MATPLDNRQLVSHTSTRVFYLRGPVTGGLCNQIEAIVGCVLLAQWHGLPLAVPRLSTHVQGGGSVSFSSVFRLDAFTSAMQQHNVAIVELLSPFGPGQAGACGWSCSPSHQGSRSYKPLWARTAWKNHTEQRRLANLPPLAIEDAVLQSLRPVERIERRVRLITERKLSGAPYGCLHPRIGTLRRPSLTAKSSLTFALALPFAPDPKPACCMRLYDLCLSCPLMRRRGHAALLAVRWWMCASQICHLPRACQRAHPKWRRAECAGPLRSGRY